MPSQALRPLTERQQAVMERIDRRVPIKVIAQELGVSETRINQHIRALKNIYEAESLGELVEQHRIENPPATAPETEEETAPSQDVSNTDTAAARGFSEAAYIKNQVPEPAGTVEQGVGTDPGELALSDVLPLIEQAPWLVAGEPQIVPRVLDGEHALWFRLAAIIAIAFGFLAAVVLTLTAAITISEALDGHAAVPVDQQGFS